MKRKDFGNENATGFIEKEPGESTYDLKTFQKSGAQFLTMRRKELEIGLQAANKMINI
jgi:hypothetical protein